MKIKAVLFDLDGTLLAMDQDKFIEEYLRALSAHFMPLGYDPAAFAKALWKGTGAMIKNNGEKKNEDVFWETFYALFPDRDVEKDLVYFDEFYEKKFDAVCERVSESDPLARKALDFVKAKGLRAVLATNPLFPAIATKKRISHAGFSPDEFDLFTTYENSRYAKPNLEYYKWVAAECSLMPEECLMVGNDVSDDMVAEALGMKVFLLTDHLINRENADVSRYPNGGFEDLIEYISSIA